MLSLSFSLYLSLSEEKKIRDARYLSSVARLMRAASIRYSPTEFEKQIRYVGTFITSQRYVSRKKAHVYAISITYKRGTSTVLDLTLHRLARQNRQNQKLQTGLFNDYLIDA